MDAEKYWKLEILDVISKLKIVCGPGCTRIFKDESIMHNIDFPAYIFKRIDGSVKFIKYYENNKRHRLYDKPSTLVFNKLGSLILVEYYLGDKLHRPRRPTFEQCLDPNNIDNAAIVSFHKNRKIIQKYYICEGSPIVATMSSLVPYHIEYYESGKLKLINYNFEDAEEIPPEWVATLFMYYEDGTIKELRYLVNKKCTNVPACSANSRPILPSVRKYYETGVLYEVLYKNGHHIHRPPEEGPAIIRYHRNGNISEEVYMVNHYHNNPNGPYLVQYNTDGIKILEEYTVCRNSTLIKKIIKYDNKGNEGNIIDIKFKSYP